MPRARGSARTILAVGLALGATATPGTAVSIRPGAVQIERLAIPADVPAHLASALAQDRSGFLWIGTQGGLVRWDGMRFRIFASDPDDPATLGGAYVRTVLATRDGRLWAGTFGGGLSVYDPTTETFRRFRHDPDDDGSLSHDRVEGLAEDRTGAIWVASSGGLDRLDPADGRIVRFAHDPADPASLASSAARGLLVDRAGRVWVGTRDGLQRLLPDGAGFERLASDPADPDSLAGDLVDRLFEDRRGRIWVGTTDRGAAVFDPATSELRRLPPGPNGLGHRWVYGFAEPLPDEIWVATFGGGVDVVDAESLAVRERLRHDPALPASIGSDRVGSILVDRSGIVWIGSWGQGIARHDPSTRAFRALRASPNRGDGLTHTAVVRALALPDGSIWAGTNGNGVDFLDRHGRRTGGLRAGPRASELTDGSVTCLERAADGTIWIATLDGTLHRLRPGASRLDRLSVADGLPGGTIRALTFARDGSVWAGSSAGLARVDPSRLETRAFRDFPGGAATPAIEAIVEAEDGTLWLGSDNGLFRFDPATAGAIRFARDPARAGSLPDNWVPDLLRDRQGRLWVATAGGACLLTHWDGAASTCEPLAPKLGRRAEPAQSMIEDDDGAIWIGPRLRFDPRRFEASAFAAADGVPFRTFFIASRARTADGTLLFGSPEGLLLVDPGAIAPWSFAPPIVATAIAVEGSPRPGAETVSALTLAEHERSFRLDFAALDLSAPERLRFRYRLSGYEARWNEADAADRSATYTGLAPGDYVLEVEGTNRAGRWSESRLRLPVTVLPAFHQTTAFRVAAVATLAALALLLHRLRIRRLEARGAELERIVATRTAELASANDELRSAYRRIEEASLTDPLTGLANRRFLEQSLGADLELVARAHRGGADSTPGEGRDLIFLLLDLDHFKSVNDTHGHAAGDAVLVELARILRATFRSSDHLVRWGGEEFLVVARFVDRSEGPALAEKLRASVASHRFALPAGGEISRTASIGFSPYPFAVAEPQGVPWERVVDLADRALYAAKRGGRNAWVGIEAAERATPVDSAFPEASALDSEQALDGAAGGRFRISTSLADPAALRFA